MELVLDEPTFMCVVQNFPNTFVPIAKLSLEGSIPSLFCGTRTYCCISGGFSPYFVSILLLHIKLEILVPSWAFSTVPIHLISTFAWERNVVLD